MSDYGYSYGDYNNDQTNDTSNSTDEGYDVNSLYDESEDTSEVDSSIGTDETVTDNDTSNGADDAIDETDSDPDAVAEDETGQESEAKKPRPKKKHKSSSDSKDYSKRDVVAMFKLYDSSISKLDGNTLTGVANLMNVHASNVDAANVTVTAFSLRAQDKRRIDDSLSFLESMCSTNLASVLEVLEAMKNFSGLTEDNKRGIFRFVDTIVGSGVTYSTNLEDAVAITKLIESVDGVGDEIVNSINGIRESGIFS